MSEVLETQPRFPLRSPEVQASIAGWYIEGLTQDQMVSRLAAEYGIEVTQQAVSYLLSHPEERMTRQMQRALDKVTDFAIADKTHRVRKLDRLATRLEERLEKQGVTYTERTREHRKIHAHPAVQALQSVLKQAAEELDQLPRAGITVNNQNVVIVKQVVSDSGNPEL